MSKKLKIFLVAIAGLAGLFLFLIIGNVYKTFRLGTANISQAIDRTDPSNPLTYDSDKDGLSDRDEILYGTDTQNPDTDGDRFLDGEEIASGYSPLQKDSNSSNGAPLFAGDKDGTPNLTSRFVNYTVASMMNEQGQVQNEQLSEKQYATIMSTMLEEAQLAFFVAPVTDSQISIISDNSPETIQKYHKSLGLIIDESFADQSNPTSNLSGLTSSDKNTSSDLYYQTYQNLKALQVPSSLKELHKELMQIALKLSLAYQFMSPAYLDSDPVKSAIALNYIQDSYLQFTNWVARLAAQLQSAGFSITP